MLARKANARPVALSWSLSALVLLLLAATEAFAERIDPRLLLEEPLLSRPQLSPNGRYVSAIYSRTGDQRILVFDLEKDERTQILRLPDPQASLRWVRWANDERLIFGVETPLPGSVSVRARASRLYGINRDGKKLRHLAKNWNRQDLIQSQDHVIDMLPDQPDHVLVQIRFPEETGDDAGVFRVHVRSGAIKSILRSKRKIDRWMTDHAGAVRLGGGWDDNEQVIIGRASSDDDFEELVRWDTRFQQGFEPIGFGPDPDIVYVLADRDGRKALYEYDLRIRKRGKLVFSHPRVDVTGPLRISRKRGVVEAVGYVDDGPELHFLDAAARRLQAGIDRALPGRANRIVSASLDESRALVRSAGDRHPPAYYIFLVDEMHLIFLFAQYPEIPEELTTSTNAFTFVARDGLAQRAFLTLPTPRDEKPPLVVYPHGGPHSRDVIGWDPTVQLLATSGYAVLRVNFRGSTGYGRELLSAGFGQWGLAMQDDLTDAVSHVVDRELVDPDRIAIYGESYGGYAAMMGLARTPDLYRCGASYAGVMDLPRLLKEKKRFIDGYEYYRARLGDLGVDGQRLRDTSPTHRAADIEAPVLLGHGTDDGRVHVRHTNRMKKALEKAGVPVTTMILEDIAHSLGRRDDRIAFQTRLLEFLDVCTAPRPSKDPPSTPSEQAQAEPAPPA